MTKGNIPFECIDMDVNELVTLLEETGYDAIVDGDNKQIRVERIDNNG